MEPQLAPNENRRTVQCMSTDEWEARAMLDLGVMISRYLAEHPCPGESDHLVLYRAWADRLLAHGRARLEDQAAVPLRVVESRH